MEVIYAPKGSSRLLFTCAVSLSFCQAVLQKKIYVYQDTFNVDPVNKKVQYSLLNLSPAEIDQQIKVGKLNRFDLIFTDTYCGTMTTLDQIQKHLVSNHITLDDNRTNPVWVKAVKEGLYDNLKIAEIPDNHYYKIITTEDGQEIVVHSASKIELIK